MDEIQVRDAVQKVVRRGRIRFLGVHPADHQPCVRDIAEKVPCCYVSNTDPCTEAGTHWVAFFFPTSDTLEFFDSYGLPPEKYGFSVPNTFHVHKNNSKFQSVSSDVCGYYCILFLFLRAKSLSFPRIISRLRRIRPSIRDLLVKSITQKIISRQAH